MSPICPQQWSDTDLRLLFLTELTACIGDDFVLVGAHARDVVCTDVVGLSRAMPSTADLDIAVAIPARGTRYADRVSGLEPTRSHTRFLLPEGSAVPDRKRVPIDVIPYGPGVADVENISLDKDRSLDATGMAEAAACSLRVQVHPDLTLRIPPLHALIALKLVAYELREKLHETKDARDLDLLLDATSRSPRAEDDCYVHMDNAPADLEWDIDLVGPWLAGVRIRRDFGPSIARRVGDAARIARLPGHMIDRSNQGVAAPSPAMRTRQLAALVAGAATTEHGLLQPWPPSADFE